METKSLENVITLLGDGKWLKDFGIVDSAILLDAVHLGSLSRKTDVDKIVKRLDSTAKHVISVQTAQIRDVDTINSYLYCLVTVYCSCLQHIKAARLIEKLWQPWMAEHSDVIKREFREQVTSVIRSNSVDLTAITSLSILLDKNKIVRELLQDDLYLMLCWMTELIETIMKLPLTQLSKCQMQNLYHVVKIGLQVFQLYSSNLTSVWNKLTRSGETTDENLVDIIWSAVKSMILILTSKNYSTDCTLLTGTALMLFINSCPALQISSDLLYSIYCYIAQSDTSADLDNVLHRPESSEKVLRCNKNLENIGCLSFINGLVVCGSNKILCYCRNDSGMFYLQLFEQIRLICEGPMTLHYQAFHLLLMWYKKLEKLLNDWKEEPISKILLPIFEQTLQLIWLNWGSPVDDVAEIVTAIFKSVMDAATVVCRGSELADMVLGRLKITPWFVKGKYRILSVLLQYTDMEKMISNLPDLQGTLLQCLSNNLLAPVAADVYRFFVLEIKKKNKEERRKQVWETMWLHTVLKGLISTDILMRSNTSNYWLSYSIKYLPQTTDSIQDSLESMLEDNRQGTDRTRILFAWLSLSRVIRNTSADFHMNLTYIREALYSDDEDVRSNAISLICNSLRKAEPLSKEENGLLMEFLPFNMKVDSAPFRQQLTRDIHSLLVRVRDSSLAALRDNNTELLDSSADFIDWFHKLLIGNLLPGACYQRRKASLEHLLILYETLVYKADSRCRKSSIPETCQLLMDYGRSRGLLDFYSASSAFSLLHCILDCADLVQESASMLLMKYHTWPLLSGDPSGPVACHLVCESLKLCNSPKTHESNSGILLCQLILHKYMVDLNWNFLIEFRIEDSNFIVSLTESVHPSSALNFMMFLLDQIDQSLANTKFNLSEVSKSRPMHGFVRALTRCLASLTHSAEGLQAIIKKFVTINMNIIHTMLSVMGTGTDVCPSFADIGVALESLIEGSLADDGEMVPLSTDFQYLMSWCWKNLKSSCMSFAEITSCYLKPSCDGSAMDVETIQMISETFFSVFTRCRHRGVIEGCRTAFLMFCTSLFATVDPELNIIPKQILEQVLSSIQQQERITTSSITRKSAGLPVIVQCVLVSEMKNEKHTLLESTLDTLFEVSMATVQQLEDDKQDLPQVHGLNILKALFSESSLSPVVIRYISSTIILVIEKFGSPYWAVRNAATRLFSTLVTKIFGQKGSAEKSCNTLTLQEFSSYYPDLPPLIMRILDEALTSDLHAIDKLHPSLFPVLTLLGNLGIQEANHEQSTLMAEFYSKLERLLGSPVYNMRHLVATACIAMVPIQKMSDVTAALVKKLVSREKKIGSNMLHGLLIFIEELLQNQMICMNRAADLLTQMLQMKFMFEASMCFIVKAKYLDVVLWLWSKCRQDIACIRKLIRDRLPDYSCDRALNVGYAMYCEREMELKLAVECNDDVLRQNIQQSLMSAHLEHRKACLLFIEKLLQSNQKSADFWKEVQLQLCKLILIESYQPLLVRCLDLITAIHLQHGSHDGTPSLLHQWVNSTGETTLQGVAISSLILPIIGILLQHSFINNDTKMIQDWANKINVASESGQNENMRTAAAQALIIAGNFVLKLTVQSRNKQLEHSVTKIFNAGLNLIQDDDIEIRKLAVVFVSGILSTECTNIHSNICLMMLFEYISSTFWWSDPCVQFLLSHLYTPGNIQTDIREVTDKSQHTLFDQEDNSFYAEKIYHSFMIHKAIKVCLQHSSSRDQCEHLSLFVSLLLRVNTDLNCLCQNISTHCPGKSVINLTTDSKVLASISGLYLLSDILLNVCKKTNCHQEKELTHLQDAISALKEEFMPTALVTMLQQATCSSGIASELIL